MNVTSFFLQTLTHLYLYTNQIGDIGAQHIAEALKENRVRKIHD